ncbi:FT-interacting protein 1-like protein [Tanacetum coccineum]
MYNLKASDLGKLNSLVLLSFQKAQRWNATLILNAAEPFEEPLILSVEDRVGPNKEDVLGRCMLPLQYVERRLDHKAINTRWFNLKKHVMVVEEEKKKKVKFASNIYMKYINPINRP